MAALSAVTAPPTPGWAQSVPQDVSQAVPEAVPLPEARPPVPPDFQPDASSDFVLRVGDIIRLYLPGEPEVDTQFQIDRTGHVDLPEVGRVELSGLTESAAETELRDRLALVFLDLSRFRLRLHERRLLVTVLGFVQQPGPVELPGDATLQQAINAAGGLNQGAQLDRIQVRRVGAIAQVVDYKAYLDTGDPALLPEMMPLDTIFVPASPLIGNVHIEFDGRTLAEAGDAAEDRSAVRVFGEVNRPASFTYREGATVIDVLMRAGGVTRYAGVESIRVITAGGPTLFNLNAYLETGDLSLMPELEPGATIFVPIQEEDVQIGGLTVYVMGEVAGPGAYESREGATFLDILANAGGPTRFADTRNIRVLRADGSVALFDLVAYTEQPGTATPPPDIVPGDAIFVPEKIDPNRPSWLNVSPDRAVQVFGAVYAPGRYEWSDEMSLFDLLAAAGGPTASGDIANLRVVRSQDGRAEPVLFDLERFLERGGSLRDVPEIRAGYVVVVPELPDDPTSNEAQWIRLASENAIYVVGQVGAPGRYAFNTNMHFLDILSAADGPTESADLRHIRVAHRNRPTPQVSRLDLALYFETGDETLLPHVLPGDVIYVPSISRDWLDRPPSETVRVLGAVNRPGRYSFSDDMTILDLLAEAGGPTAMALEERIVVVNLSCCEDQAQSFDLLEFARTGDFSMLPVVRVGDTVYVPQEGDSTYRIVMDGVRDVISVLGLVAIIGAL